MTSWSRNTLSRSRIDQALRWVCIGSALTSAALVMLVVGFLIKESWMSLAEIGPTRFASDTSWHPLSDQFRLTPMIAATLITTLGAILVAGPLGVASAVFYQFYAPAGVAIWFRRLIELLAGIPSVVFGFWGLVVLSPMIAARFGGSGQCLLTATLILGLMILPTVALTSMAALKTVPEDWTKGGAALGIDRFGIVWQVALPAAKKGIGVGVLLAICRALGETMAMTMVAGNIAGFPDSFLSPVRTLTANMAMEMGYATEGHRSTLFLTGLVLMLVVTTVAVLANRFSGNESVFDGDRG